jgi:hypothetical protein
MTKILCKTSKINLFLQHNELYKKNTKNIKYYENFGFIINNINLLNNNFVLNNNFCKTLSSILNKNIVLNDLHKYIVFKTDLSVIFEEINFDYKNIEVIILSLPKTGSTNLQDVFSQYYVTIHIHSIIELLYKDIRFIGYNIIDIIYFLENNSNKDKIFIIQSYREPCSRYLSKFFHDLVIYQLYNIKNEFTNIYINFENINIDNYHFLFYIKDHIHMIELNKCLNIDIDSYTYNYKDGYTLFKKSKKLNIIFTMLEDIDLFFRNCYKFADKIIYEDIKDYHSNKNTSDIYISKKNKIIIDDEVKEILYNREIELVKFYGLINKLKIDF